jgi:hypothetical protein
MWGMVDIYLRCATHDLWEVLTSCEGVEAR